MDLPRPFCGIVRRRRTGVRVLGGWRAEAVLVVALLACCAVERQERGSKTGLPEGPTFVKADTEDIDTEDFWEDDLFDFFRPKFTNYMQECPVHVYRRTCGTESTGSIQIVLPLGQWNLEELTSEERVTEFMLFLRFVLETFWRKVVKQMDSEHGVVFIVDMKGLSASRIFFLWSGVSRMFKLANNTLKNAAGKSWSRAYIINASYAVTKLLDLLSRFVSIRRQDMVVLSSTESGDAKILRRELGAKCLWAGYGGDSAVGLGDSALQKAFTSSVLFDGAWPPTESPLAASTAEGTVSDDITPGKGRK